jgi:transitional endoplasmic reticulum ATPase
MRQTLRCHIGDELVLSPVDVPDAERLVVQTPVDISRAHGLREELRAALVESRTPCTKGLRLYAAPGGSAGMVYEVGDVQPVEAIVAEGTAIEFVTVEEGTASGIEIGFEDVGGLATEVQALRELVELPLRAPSVYRKLGIRAPRGVVLCGPPGSGKTHLARAVANDLGARVFTINGPSVVGTSHGETESNLRKIFNEAAHHAPSLVLIDEVDGLAPNRREAGSQTDIRTVTTLLACMDGMEAIDGVVVIGTTNRIDDVDPALRRPGRFDREIVLAPPDATGRLEILEIHARDMPLTDQAVAGLKGVADAAVGFVGADIVELCREAGLSALRRQHSVVTNAVMGHGLDGDFDIFVDESDFLDALGRVRPSASREASVEHPDFDWDELVGLDPLKLRLDRLVTAQVPRATAAHRVGAGHIFGSGILLVGPEGSGKTALARGLAARAGIGLCIVNGPELFGRWLGESESALREVFTIARRLAPTILFLDQLDSIAPVRGSDGGSMTTARVVNQLLAEIDSTRAFGRIALLAATNRVDLIDPAVLQPNRFGIHLRVELPDEQARRAIVARLLTDGGLAEGAVVDELAGLVATKTDSYSAARLQQLVETVALNAVDLGEAGEAMLPSLLQSELEQALEL